MHTESPVESQPYSTVTARARVCVTRLDDRGLALARVTSWLTFPTDEEWSAIYSNRAIERPLPEHCAFVGGLPDEVIEVEFQWPIARPGRRMRRPPEPRICIHAILAASADRTSPGCPLFGECGGCQLQHLTYGRQLAWKTERVRELLHAAAFADISVEPALGCADPWHYRNHMRFSVNRQGQPGLTARGSHRVLPLHSCPIAHPLINRALDILSAQPCQRPQLLIRCGTMTNQVLVQPAPDQATSTRLAAEGINLCASEYTEALRVPADEHAEPTRAVPLAEFRIRPSSFFQTNTEQANQMAAIVLASLPTGPGITVVDAYCGVGTFAALLAPHVGNVLAIEESASAIRDAMWNLREYPNVEIIQAKTEAILPALSQSLDGLVIDPPRAGCQPAVLDALRARSVPRIVYVSCAPETLARDLAYLCRDGAYHIRHIQPLDMFPQTAHIETIVALEVDR